MLDEVKRQIDEMGRAWEEFKATHKLSVDEVKKLGASDVLLEQKLERLNGVLDKIEQERKDLSKKVDEVEKLAARPVRQGDRDGEVYSAEQVEHRSAFLNFARTGEGEREIRSLERKAMSVGVDTEGGYLAPMQMVDRIVTILQETTPMRQYAEVMTVGVKGVEFPADTSDETTGGWVAEKQTRPETTAPDVRMMEFVCHEQYANPAVTQNLLEDAAFNIEQWLVNKMTAKLGRVENTAFVAGSGIGKPKGFTAYTTAATGDATRAWGQLEHVKSGTNGSIGTTGDALIDVVHAFKDGYLNGSGVAWFLPRAVLGDIRKLKGSDNNYLWQPGLSAGAPPTLLQFPYVVSQDMPAKATDSLSVALGNWRLGYLIVDRAVMTVLRDPFTNKPFVHFYMRKRVGGGVQNFEAIKFLKLAA